MEWKPIKLTNVQIKPIYEISSDGDIRKSTTGRILKGKGDVTLSMADGTNKRFLRKKLHFHAFQQITEGWRMIQIPNVNIKPIYEISLQGEIRRLDNGRILTGTSRVMLSMADGTNRHFFREYLVKKMFPECFKPKFDEESHLLLQQLIDVVKDAFPAKQIKIVPSDKVDNMIIIDNAMSVKKETPYGTVYAIRRGKHFHDPAYYGYHKPNSRTYKEVELDDLMYVICEIIRSRKT